MLELKAAALLFWKLLEEKKTEQIEIVLEDGRKVMVVVESKTQRPELKLVSGND